MQGPQVPLRLSTVVWESRPQRFNLTVAAQGVLRLRPGAEAVYEDPLAWLPPSDDWAGRIARQNLCCPHKPRADWVLLGHAYAPPGEEVERLIVRMTLGDYTKALSVSGDRLWRREGARWMASPPRRFAQLSLSSERALLSAENPVGIDPSAIPIEHRLAMPNIEPVGSAFQGVVGPVPAHAPSRAGALPPPALAWAGSFDPFVPAHHALGRGPMPEGMNFAHFQIAPADQQLAEIPLGSALVLENAHPAHAVLTSRLPALAPKLRAHDPSTGAWRELTLRCDTLWIDGDRGTVDVVFRGVLELTRPDALPALAVALEPVAPSVPKESARLMSTQQIGLAPSPGSSAMLTTQMGALEPSAALGRGGAALPFVNAAPGTERHPGFDAAPAGHASGPSAFADESTAEVERGSYPPPPVPRARSITAELELPEESTALPFGADAPTSAWEEATPLDDEATIDRAELRSLEPEAAPPLRHPTSGASVATLAPPPIEPDDEATAEESASAQAGPRALPFGAPAEPRPPRVPLPTQRMQSAPPSTPPRLETLPPAPEHVDAPDQEPPTLAAPTARIALPQPPAQAEHGRLEISSVDDGAPRIAPGLQPLGDPGPPPEVEATAPPPLPEHFESDPPEAIAHESAHEAAEPNQPAVAHLDAEAAAFGGFVDEPTPPAEPPIATERAEPPEAPLPPAPPIRRDALSLESCAALRAALSRPVEDRAALFARFEVDEAVFLRSEREHLKALDEASRSGSSELLDRYDDAFVAALDAERAPIDVLGYARLQYAKESGQLADVLAELGVARSELMRLERVWRRKLASDRALADQMEDELERLRSS